MYPQLSSLKRPSPPPTPEATERPEKHPRIETTATTATDEHVPRKNGDRARRLRQVNRGVMGMLEGTLRRDPSADLTTLLESYVQLYPDRRRKAEEKALKAALRQESTEPLASGESRFPREVRRLLQVPSGTPEILRPLSPSVLALIAANSIPTPPDTPASPAPPEPAVAPTISQSLLTSGALLHSTPTQVTLQLTPTITVHLGPLETSQSTITAYIAARTTLPVPTPLGALKIDQTIYTFSSHLPGTTLEARWPALMDTQKLHVKTQLNTLLLELRSLPPPPTELGWAGQCKDLRRHVRQSGPISCEAELNSFLLQQPRSGVVGAYLEMLRTRMRDDHRIVFTHGNLIPRNIMVDEELRIMGLVGWEMGGWYPEHWEHLKALNAFSGEGAEDGDWWRYLPECIAPYHAEWALDRQMEAVVRC